MKIALVQVHVQIGVQRTFFRTSFHPGGDLGGQIRVVYRRLDGQYPAFQVGLQGDAGVGILPEFQQRDRRTEFYRRVVRLEPPSPDVGKEGGFPQALRTGEQTGVDVLQYRTYRIAGISAIPQIGGLSAQEDPPVLTGGERNDGSYVPFFQGEQPASRKVGHRGEFVEGLSGEFFTGGAFGHGEGFPGQYPEIFQHDASAAFPQRSRGVYLSGEVGGKQIADRQVEIFYIQKTLLRHDVGREFNRRDPLRPGVKRPEVARVDVRGIDREGKLSPAQALPEGLARGVLLGQVRGSRERQVAVFGEQFYSVGDDPPGSKAEFSREMADPAPVAALCLQGVERSAVVARGDRQPGHSQRQVLYGLVLRFFIVPEGKFPREQTGVGDVQVKRFFLFALEVVQKQREGGALLPGVFDHPHFRAV